MGVYTDVLQQPHPSGVVTKELLTFIEEYIHKGSRCGPDLLCDTTSSTKPAGFMWTGGCDTLGIIGGYC